MDVDWLKRDHEDEPGCGFTVALRWGNQAIRLPILPDDSSAILST